MDSINSIKADVLVVFYKGKKVTLDITKELLIDESLLNTNLKRFPSNYAFLTLIKERYIKKKDKLLRERDKAFSELWVFYKESGNIANELATHKTNMHPKYNSLSERYEKVNYMTSKLISICKAYESRERILQTLSANLRKTT